MAPATAGRGAPMPAATLIRAAPTVPAAPQEVPVLTERGYNDKFWINDLKSDINQERDSSADDPRADHQSYSDQDHDSRKSLCQLIYNFIFHILPGIPQKET